ncbi:amino acid adenylation domain-containing protein [Streptomyces sp. MBT62]|uniref:amino acid adenylation domain-containing protein n=1 Tax=Streptomyces sp. MBT62 TaxID=2800410 RepID=UPI00190B00FB|nr:amino acid adenylation domain-containing protein [Streptomyces sp. MBT62]MBK3568632.1 amino acid adenylation domain-containing protein [Streptomyces sp. MBT62]
MGVGLIHQAVAHQARTAPEALAVVDGDIRLDYATLDAVAGDWAGHLAAAGAGPGTLIPVQLPRSARLYVALLALLKCGAGYAALDPRWPRERVDDVLRQLDAPVLVTDLAETSARQPVWRPPAELSAPGGADDGFRAYEGPEDTAAAVFFTSGTSGTPKGVVSPHAATTRLFAPDGPLAFGPGTVMLQAAPASWDAFSLELWGMLTTGGTCVTARDDYLLPDTLRHAIDTRGVDTGWLTASLFNLFTEIDPDCFQGLRRLYIGGEKLSTAHVGAFLDRHPGIQLLNGYGPVESCVFVTVHPIAAPDCAAAYGVPIGREVPGTAVHVLDDAGAVCAPGAVGELCVSGTGLALGYLGDPALTGARFQEARIADAHLRVYRTGDRGFRDTDGVLHFTGRTDRQVKIRGYRIEPEEIEAHAAGLPGITHCVAVPVPGRLGTYERLALFYTSATSTTSATEDSDRTDGTDDSVLLRRSLGRLLPAHAVPDVVRRVERLPVTANGKVDRSELLALLPG